MLEPRAFCNVRPGISITAAPQGTYTLISGNGSLLLQHGILVVRESVEPNPSTQLSFAILNVTPTTISIDQHKPIASCIF
eukprot:586873-Rhodomonas_salina.1